MTKRLVAFLRGINLGSRRVKMAELRRHFAALGLEGVGSHGASGNVVFDDPGDPREELEQRIAARLHGELGFPVDTVVRSLEEVATILGLAVVQEAEARDLNVYVTFAGGSLDEGVRAAFEALETAEDRFHVLEDTVVWLREGGLSDSTVKTPDLEAAFGGRANTRRKTTTLRKLVKRFWSS